MKKKEKILNYLNWLSILRKCIGLCFLGGKLFRLILGFVAMTILVNIYIFFSSFFYTYGSTPMQHINSWKWGERWKGSVTFTCWKSLPNRLPLIDLICTSDYKRVCFLTDVHIVFACFSDCWQIQWRWCGHIYKHEESWTSSFMFKSLLYFLFFFSAVCFCELSIHVLCHLNCGKQEFGVLSHWKRKAMFCVFCNIV